MPPAWMAELSEEWVEPPEDQQQHEQDQRQASTSPGLDFGSLVIKDARLPSPVPDDSREEAAGYGTTVFHDAPAGDNINNNAGDGTGSGSILFTPSKQHHSSANVSSGKSIFATPFAASPANHLAMAAAAFKNNSRHNALDALQQQGHMQNTPNRLQSLFLQPTPEQSCIEASQSGLAGSDSVTQPEEAPSQQAEGGEEHDAEAGPEEDADDAPREEADVQHDHGDVGTNVTVDEEQDIRGSLRSSTHENSQEYGGHSHAEATDPSHLHAHSFSNLLDQEEPDHLQEESPSPETGGLIPPTTEFSFRVSSRSTPEDSSQSRVSQRTPDRCAVNVRDFATSTPSVASSSHNRREAELESSSSSVKQVNSSQAVPTSPAPAKTTRAPGPSPALSIFKFQQDTYTREHLQALVADIDALTSPPRQVEASTSGFDISGSQLGLNSALVSSRRAQYVSPSREHGDIYPFADEQRECAASVAYDDEQDQGPPSETQEHSYHTANGFSPAYDSPRPQQYEDENDRLVNTRSSKRVRLSVSDLRRSPSPRKHITNRIMPRNGFSPLRRGRAGSSRPLPHTASKLGQLSRHQSAVGLRESPSRPPLRSLPPMTAPVARSYNANFGTSVHTAQEHERFRSGAAETPKHRSPQRPARTPAHMVQNRLQEARALMERIRQRHSEREASLPSAPSLQEEPEPESEPSQHSSPPSIAITPDPGSVSTSYLGTSEARRVPGGNSLVSSRPPNPTPMTAATAHQLRRMPSGLEPTPEETEENHDEQQDVDVDRHGSLQDLSTPDEERLDSLAPLPQIGQAPIAQASVRATLSQTPLAKGRPGRLSSFGSTSGTAGGSTTGRTFATAPHSVASGSHNTYLRAPEQPASFSSHTSSDRFFTSTSTRIVSNSTAPSSLVASTVDTVKAGRAGFVNIPPGEAQDFLTEDVLGDMVFDNEQKKWIKMRDAAGLANPAAASAIQIPELSPIHEVPATTEDSATEDDPFRDLTGFESSRSKSDNSGQPGDNTSRHSRSGSLVLVRSAALTTSQTSERTEKTSTPPHASVVHPFVSPDLPSIQEASSRPTCSRIPSSEQPRSSSTSSAGLCAAGAGSRSVSSTSVPPKSALKRSDPNAFSTPMPCSRIMSRLNTKQSRSVSFSDGRVPGRGDSFEQRVPQPGPSALRNQLPESPASTRSDDNDEQEGQRQDAIDREEKGALSFNAQTSTATRPNVSTSQHFEGRSRQGTSHAYAVEDTPTAVYHSDVRPRSLRLKPKLSDTLGNSVVSTTSTLAWHRKPLNANATILTECSFGVSYDRLLRVLTDVVPFEPSWKDLKTIDLHERGIESVVRLKEFIPALDEIDLSNNNLAYLTGLPASLRFLSLANNRLSDLSSFGYLQNLESVDISGNAGISSVHQLGCLKHLRTLKADRCAIESIDGIDQLDGLVTLSISNNALTELRLETTSYLRLETLDVSDNNLVELTGLESLPSLKAVNLDHNKLLHLELSETTTSLRILKVSNNGLQSLNLAAMPNLRTMFADSNRISTLSGTERLKKLENLSLREQRQGSIDFPVKDLRDVRRLYLSYNPIPETFPAEQFLNLTLLELSGCRLTSLPSDFAALVPNCRLLILDNNFLTSLSPIAGVKRLQVVSATGNRLEKVREMLGIWLECSCLETLDLRLNPMTLGLYPSPNIPVAPPNMNLVTEATAGSKAYKAMDSAHRHTLPNEWLARRTAYRSLIIEAVPSLHMLDGLKIGRQQRQRARDIVEKYAC